MKSAKKVFCFSATYKKIKGFQKVLGRKNKVLKFGGGGAFPKLGHIKSYFIESLDKN